MLDVTIVGGGATGGAMALGMANQTELQVGLVDAGGPPAPESVSTGFDQRTVALSHSSMEILSRLGVQLSNLTRSPIQHIHVSDQYHAGQTRLHAQEHGIDAFGYVVSLAALGAQIYGDLNQSSGQFLYRSETQVNQIQRHGDHSVLTLNDGSELSSRLVVLAEGGRTGLAETLGLTRREEDYGQTALTFVVNTTEPHNGWAYERFTEHGPLALLPLSAHEFGVVWTVESSRAQCLLEATDKAFMQALQQAFGYRCGLFHSLSERASYPLALRQLTPPFSHGVVAIGNSAQTLHPIAGQGVNLGFRDVFSLLTELKACQPEQINLFTTLARYQQRRNDDKNATISMTDGLVRSFSNSHLPMVMGRNIALTGLNLLGLAKWEFAQSAMGYKNATL